MSRMSRGCFRCRSRKVKCDEGRPSCLHCIRRGEVCTGYRDEASLIFRNETERTAKSSLRRFSSVQSFSSSRTSSVSSSTPLSDLSRNSSPWEDQSSLSPDSLSDSSLATANFSQSPTEDQAVSNFFEKYVMYPCNQSSSPGFLEHLPPLFREARTEGRIALRHAVRAVSYASLSNDHGSVALAHKALHCYGLALTALAKALAEPGLQPDDYMLMTVVILDMFEALHLKDSVAMGSHAEGMAQILRLRGPEQIYSPRSWSVFRLAHHRLQRQRIMKAKGPFPEAELWLESSNQLLPSLQNEKLNSEISHTCAQARELLGRLQDLDLPIEETLRLVNEVHLLDAKTSTWRNGPEWKYKVIYRSEITNDPEEASKFPACIEIHQDVWTAFEWNYHRTARILMHENLLQCLHRLRTTSHVVQQSLFEATEQSSISTIRALADDILSTVPQSFGDIDHEGNVLKNTGQVPKCAAIGGYFLLWPMKIIKNTASATEDQRVMAQRVFQRIRECTGMKTALGERSNI